MKAHLTCSCGATADFEDANRFCVDIAIDKWRADHVSCAARNQRPESIRDTVLWGRAGIGGTTTTQQPDKQA